MNSPDLTSRAGLNILMVAPQPFFRPRGTPFSVLHRIRAMTALGHKVHLITYPLGDDVTMPGLTIQRSARVPFVKDVIIGPSIGKLLLDVPMVFATLNALRSRKFDLVHSHEEAAFFCAPLARRYGALHVYDMHSSLPQQLANFGAFNFGFIRNAFRRLEHYVLQASDGVITICKELADIATEVCPQTPHAMIENTGDDSNVFTSAAGDVRARLGLTDRDIVLYTGTFEHYQGLDLLLDAWVSVAARNPRAHLLMVGGAPEQVRAHEAKAAALNLADRVTFVGQVHPSLIPSHVAASDVIVSPRSRGTNTPLKIYGYLRSGKPIVATNLPTHTQTLNSSVAELVEPTAASLADGLVRVLGDKGYAAQLAAAARVLSDDQYSDAAYMRRVDTFFAAVLANARRSVVPARAQPTSDNRKYESQP